jgi:2,5-diamino-6-(ribosylamino)-4(3H)-pyrimidinone 5'-phosphate reductase
MKIILCNEISFDGSVTGFEFNSSRFYKTIGETGYDIHLVGSATAKKGIEMFTKEIPKETPKDFQKPNKNETPIWAIVDSTGLLNGLLHVYRNSEYVGEIVVFVSENTPKDYIKYLKVRNYEHYVLGKYNVDLKKMVRTLEDKYKSKTMIVDSGGILSGEFIEQGLVNEIHFVISPNLVGENRLSVFRAWKKNLKLNLIKEEKIDDHVYLVYGVKNEN